MQQIVFNMPFSWKDETLLVSQFVFLPEANTHFEVTMAWGVPLRAQEEQLCTVLLCVTGGSLVYLAHGSFQ